MNWYQLSTKEVVELLESSEKGLTDSDVKERLFRYGPNKLAEEEKISKFRILLHQFMSPLIYILLIAGVVTIMLREYIDSGVIFAVVILNAVIGYVQEFKAEESVRALKKMVVPKAKVLREGREREINSEELVPGDIVLLSSGSKVPADLRLIGTIELKVEEAMLTGESVPAEKTIDALEEENLISGDQRNMVFMGTVVVFGRAKGIVVGTGVKTELGKIAEDVRSVAVVKTPLQQKLERFTRMIAVVIVGFSAVIFGAGIMIGTSAAEMFLVAVATAVSAIPEGLPVAVTIAMAIGVSRMARRNSIIRKLPAVETLGSTTVIGSDKTGTLTRNEMTVKLVYDGQHTFEISGSGYEPTGEILLNEMPVADKEKQGLRQALRIGLLCNESDVYQKDNQYKVDGDPTEGALIVAAMKAGLEPETERTAHPRLDMIPFESERGYMVTLHEYKDKKLVMVKGAPERVLEMCSGTMMGERLKKAVVSQVGEDYAREGLRVLAMAYREAPPEMMQLSHHEAETGLVFAGLQGMIDPPRDEVIRAVEGCKKAGIRVVMITGDHAVTAMAIAKKIGIGDENPDVLTGKELETMSDEDLFAGVQHTSVYARVSPQHKLRITQQLLLHGEIVAITGDGVNDAPALKAAHIGVAMGMTGTDVAKEASDMVIADDNFASIFAAVEEGRVVYDNIKKVTLFLISCGSGELIAIVGTLLLGYPIPYIPAQILWLNLVTNGFQDVALAFEPAEKGVLRRRPLSPRTGILSRLMIERTLIMGAVLAAGTLFVFITDINDGVPLEKARTVALTTMVFFQFYQAFNCRSETESIFRMNPLRNPLLFFSMIAAFFAQLAVLYVPALQWVFRTEPISVTEWVRIGLVSSTIIAVVEFEKWLRRKRERRISFS